jgi:hypothetical protein
LQHSGESGGLLKVLEQNYEMSYFGLISVLEVF